MDRPPRQLALARCTHPSLAGRSAYTVLGFAGYAAGAIASGVLATVLGFSMVERLVALCVPPIAFLATIMVARRRAGYERIVFYEALCACLATSALAAWLAGGDVARTLDVATVGIGVFLVLGRVGCFRVACCHGRPARRGVRYGRPHVVIGFPAIWEGRPVVPVQLIEAGASLVLAGAAAILSLGRAGDATALYIAGYAVVRFHLELVRGDRDRRYAWGLSEAQRMAVVTCAAASALHPGVSTWVPMGVLLIASGALVATRHRASRVLLRSGHVHELQSVQQKLGVATSGKTSEGLAVTRYVLPDGRTDFVWSRDRGLSVTDARRLAMMLDTRAEVVPGQVPGLVHVVIPAPPDR
jgi:prolipoprotein diacylglyceryltransferase